jgi:hypothetical protein
MVAGVFYRQTGNHSKKTSFNINVDVFVKASMVNITEETLRHDKKTVPLKSLDTKQQDTSN